MPLTDFITEWANSKARIFDAERYEASVSEELGVEKKARYVELVANGLLARATVWEDGALELEALDVSSGETVIQSSRIAATPAALGDSLNWWLSEIAIYGRAET